MKQLLFLVVLATMILSLKANEDSVIVYSLLEQAEKTSNSDSSNNFVDKAMTYSKKHNYLDGVLTVAKHYGNEYAKTGDIKASISFYQKIIKEYKFNTKQLSTIYNQIGIYHVYMGHYDSTEVYFLKALSMRELLKDSVGIGASLNNLGNVIQSKGDYDKATEYFIKSLRIRERINDSLGIASSMNNLGLIYYKQQKFEEAIRYYQKALNIYVKHKEINKEALILLNLGNIYDEKNQLDSAVHFYSVAIKKAEEFGEARLKAMAYGNMGVTQDKKGNFDLAKEYYSKALQIRIESNDLHGQAVAYNNLAVVNMSTKNYTEAIQYFIKSLQFSEQINFMEATRDNYLGLSDAYKKTNKFKESLEAHEMYVAVKDSMFNETTNQQIEEITTKYETEKKEKQIAQQKVEIGDEQLKVKQRNYILLALGLGLLFIIILAIYIYKQQKFKQQKLIEENRLKDELALIKVQNELHQERLRISRDLHDNIGSQLTFVISSVDNLKYVVNDSDKKIKSKLTDVSSFTRTTITQLRDTIWALNKDEISFDDLKARLYNYIETANLSQEQTKFEVKETLQSKIFLNSIQGVNIYRIVQEAINNVMKYAAASRVELNITENDNYLNLKIIDDGIGFKMGEIDLGNGLENMRNRAHDINAEFDIKSLLEEGTTISIAIPKNEFNPNKPNAV